MTVSFAASRRVSKRYGKEGLLRALEHEGGRTRARAAHFLQHHPGRDTQVALLRATRDAEPYVRMWAAFSLGKIGDASVAERLRQLQLDPEWIVVSRATDALDELQQRTAAPD